MMQNKKGLVCGACGGATLQLVRFFLVSMESEGLPGVKTIAPRSKKKKT